MQCLRCLVELGVGHCDACIAAKDFPTELPKRIRGRPAQDAAVAAVSSSAAPTAVKRAAVAAVSSSAAPTAVKGAAVAAVSSSADVRACAAML